MLSLVPIERRRERVVPSLFDRFFDDSGFRFFEDLPVRQRSFSPAVEVAETDSELVFTVELPGIEQKDLSINVNDSVLTFSGERKAEEKTEGRGYVRSERWYGKFSRSFRLPETADVEKISAKLKEGLLTVVVAKKEESKPRQINVRVS